MPYRRRGLKMRLWWRQQPRKSLRHVLHPRPQQPSSFMVELEERPDHRRASHDRASPSAELPCRDAASSSAAQTSMSARARRAIACANRSSRSTHPPAHYPTCREARTGTSHACRTRTAQLALAAAAIRFRVAAMLPVATQAGMHLGTTHRQAGVPRKRPAGRRRASEAPPSTKKAEPTPTRRYNGHLT